MRTYEVCNSDYYAGIRIWVRYITNCTVFGRFGRHIRLAWYRHGDKVQTMTQPNSPDTPRPTTEAYQKDTIRHKYWSSSNLEIKGVRPEAFPQREREKKTVKKKIIVLLKKLFNHVLSLPIQSLVFGCSSNPSRQLQEHCPPALGRHTCWHPPFFIEHGSYAKIRKRI